MARISIVLICIVLFVSQGRAYELISNRTVVRNDTLFSSQGLILSSGPFTLNTDSAYMLRNDSIIYFIVPFELSSHDTLSIYGRSGSYLSSSGIFRVSGNDARMKDMHIRSDSALLSQRDSIHQFIGNVHMIDGDGSAITCDFLTVNMKDNLETAGGDFAYISADSSMSIFADMYRRDKTDSVIDFSGSSEIMNKDTKILSDSFSMDMRTDILFTPLACRMLYNDYVITGDSLYAYFHSDTIDSAFLASNVKLVEDNEERTNTFRCRSMIMEFLQSELQEIRFMGIFDAVLIMKEKQNDIKSE